jgi:hypothetical protein
VRPHDLLAHESLSTSPPLLSLCSWGPPSTRCGENAPRTVATALPDKIHRGFSDKSTRVADAHGERSQKYSSLGGSLSDEEQRLVDGEGDDVGGAKMRRISPIGSIPN